MTDELDLLVVGAGPVGLMCGYLGKSCGLSVMVVDKSDSPLSVGRADALNARSLQLLELAGLFDALYPQGITCNISSVWSNGEFISKQSKWWDSLEGCLHKHFLMLGQAYVEAELDKKLKLFACPVQRSVSITDIESTSHGCITKLSDDRVVKSKYIIGADGAHSFVRKHFDIGYEITRPEITWAVIDAVFDTDFPDIPEITVFQSRTADVARIPREGNIDRFYIRMDIESFELEDALLKINHAMKPHRIAIKNLVWFSRFSVKESVADNFFVNNRIFLAGDSCHIHSVNGGQGLNTGIADAFNLIWKINMVLNQSAQINLLHSYEAERKPVAMSVIESSGELVRATKYADKNDHARKYINIIEKRSGNITGMGIRYSSTGLQGSRLFDFNVYIGEKCTRLYSLLNYSIYTLLVCSNTHCHYDLPDYVCCIRISSNAAIADKYWADKCPYVDQTILIRPDSYIAAAWPNNSVDIQREIYEKTYSYC
jgi:2-polyprenyl-6-methoxyphenol hydroxylase-like FAD-dependent oxidoreductase